MLNLFRRRKPRYIPRHLDTGQRNAAPLAAIGPATRYLDRKGAYGNDWPTIVIDTNAPIRHFTGTKPRPRLPVPLDARGAAGTPGVPDTNG